MKPVEATRESRCELCECQIEEGDQIVVCDDADWVHAQCAEDEGFKVHR